MLYHKCPVHKFFNEFVKKVEDFVLIKQDAKPQELNPIETVEVVIKKNYRRYIAGNYEIYQCQSVPRNIKQPIDAEWVI